MSVERWIRLIAGAFIILSVSLSYVQSRYWLWFTLFVGVNLFQSALTRWCLMEDILRKLGVGETGAPPARARLAQGNNASSGRSAATRSSEANNVKSMKGVAQ